MNSLTFARSDLRYFKLDRVAGSVFQLYLSVTILSLLKMSRKTVANGIIRNHSGKSHHWSSFSTEGTIWIRYHSIPKNTLHRHNLPCDPELMYRKLQESDMFEEELNKDIRTVEIYNTLEYAYLNGFPTFVKDASKYFTKEEKIRYAKNAALISQIINLIDRNEPADLVFASYKKLAIKELTNLS